MTYEQFSRIKKTAIGAINDELMKVDCEKLKQIISDCYDALIFDTFDDLVSGLDNYILFESIKNCKNKSLMESASFYYVIDDERLGAILYQVGKSGRLDGIAETILDMDYHTISEWGNAKILLHAMDYAAQKSKI